MADDILLKVRTGSKDVVMAGDTVNQTLTLTNRSSYVIWNPKIVDTFSDGVSFVANSVQIDGKSYTGYDPVAGFELPYTINANSSATITYKILVGENPPKNMTVYSLVSYRANGITYENEKSSTYNLELANGDLTVTKTNNRSVVIAGDTLTYQVVLNNIGTAKHTNVSFRDPLPAHTQFVAGSLAIDGVIQPDLDPNVGFTLADIPAKSQVTITFDVTIT